MILLMPASCKGGLVVFYNKVKVSLIQSLCVLP